MRGSCPTSDQANGYVGRLNTSEKTREAAALPQSPNVLPIILQFLLEVDDVHGLAQGIEPWRKDVSIPLRVEVRTGEETTALAPSF